MNELQRKVGPLPLYAWGLVVVGAFLAWRWYSSHQQDSALGGTAADSHGLGYTYVPMGDQSGSMGEASGGGAGMNGAGVQPIDVTGDSGAGTGSGSTGGSSTSTSTSSASTPASSAAVTNLVSAYQAMGSPPLSSSTISVFRPPPPPVYSPVTAPIRSKFA